MLVTPNVVMIGLSARTDKSGATDCSLLDEETVLATHRLAGSGFFRGMREIVTPEGEEAAANALRVNDVVFVGADYPRTIDLLDREGYKVVAVKTGEIGRIDAGLSCMSLRWRR